MKGMRLLIVACLATMTAALGWGFTVGDFWGEGAILMRMPWGVISIIDVYAGATLFTGWIAYRERSPLIVASWAIAIFVLGNFATSTYALWALSRSGGDAHRFWLGRASDRHPHQGPK